MHFGFVKAQNHRIGDWNSPLITQMQRISADFSKGCYSFSVKSVLICRVSVIRGELSCTRCDT